MQCDYHDNNDDKSSIIDRDDLECTKIYSIFENSDSSSTILEFNSFDSLFTIQFIKEIKYKIAELIREKSRLDYLALYEKRNAQYFQQLLNTKEFWRFQVIKINYLLNTINSLNKYRYNDVKSKRNNDSFMYIKIPIGLTNFGKQNQGGNKSFGGYKQGNFTKIHMRSQATDILTQQLLSEPAP
ncbi:Hypothetical_protein [Hexamita inflata]|uniref:Hypothetical_protein n=1 Tax=Hexamita inflata TaxID=28002 RepID=A0AA86R5P2_9EUKA|nr:Hypothetical protein HINF_LOCUS57013 [Hexamita inflata]